MNDKKPAKKSQAVEKPEFTGHISGLSSAKAGAEFHFEVVSKKHGSRSYQVDGGKAAVVVLVTAAYVGGKKITVLDAAASEIRLGAKPKAPKVPKVPKVKAEKPPKRINGPVIETPPAA
jgi:hypothetical protein